MTTSWRTPLEAIPDGLDEETDSSPLPQSRLEDVQDVFHIFNQQGKGNLHMAELKIALLMLGWSVSTEEARALTALFCADKVRGFSLDEFVSVCEELTRTRSFASQQAAREVFALLDSDHTGTISVQQIAQWGAEVEALCRSVVEPAEVSGKPMLEHAAPSRLTDPLLDSELATEEGIVRMLKDFETESAVALSRREFYALLDSRANP